MADALRPTPQAIHVPPRQPWTLPRLAELPKLTALTLASAIGGTGGTGGSGSTVFALLLAVMSLALLPACSADRSVEPGTTPAPRTTYAVSCEGSVKTKSVTCGGPEGAPGQVILGGQDKRVVLTSSGVAYDTIIATPEIFEFDVTVQNLTPTTIGWDGASNTGVKVFFTADPAATVGSGAITVENGLQDIFLSASHDYFLYAQSLVPFEISAPQHWQLHVPATVDNFTFTVLVAADVEQVSDPLFWTEVDGLNHHYVNGVASNGSGNALAVGSNGATWRLNGFSWDPVTVAFNVDFVDVAATGGDTYLGALSDGTVERFNGTRWEPTGCNSTSPLYAISALDATHWIAVGSHFTVVQDGGTCTLTSLNIGGSFFKFASAGPDGRYLAASLDGDYFLSDDGVTWGPAVNFFAASVDPRSLTGVFLDADGDIIWSFTSVFEPHGAVVRNVDDTLFATVGVWPDAIAPMALDGRDSVTVAYSDVGVQAWLGKLTYNGTPDTTSLGAPVMTGEQFSRISNGPAFGSDWLAVTTYGGLYRLNGTDNFLQGPEPTNSAFLWQLADTTVLVNGSGGYYRMTPGSLIGEPTPFEARAIAGYATGAETALWAIDPFNVYARYPGGSWFAELTSVVATDSFTAIAVSSAHNLWVAVGTNGTLYSSTGGGWAQVDLSPFNDKFTAAWIDPVGVVAYLTTEQGGVYTWDGTNFAPLVDLSGLGPLTAITGTGGTDIWFGGSGGRIYQWDGGAFTEYTSGSAPPFDIRSLASTEPGEVLAGMTNSFVVHYSVATPGSATAYRLPGVSNSAPVTGLAVGPHGRVYAAGANFTFLGRR